MTRVKVKINIYDGVGIQATHILPLIFLKRTVELLTKLIKVNYSGDVVKGGKVEQGKEP